MHDEVLVSAVSFILFGLILLLKQNVLYDPTDQLHETSRWSGILNSVHQKFVLLQ